MTKINNESIVIIKALPDDAEAIMTIKRDAWLGAYTNEELDITAEDIRKKLSDDMMPTAIQNWRRGIASEKDGGNRATFVARINGEVVGCTSPHTQDGQKRVGALYVSPDVQGKGIGSKLLTKALKWHGPEHDIYLLVVSYDHNAISLYKHFGFQETGVEIPGELNRGQGIKLLPEIEMVLKAS